mmetsp:Transcript_32176/g.52175  ORF Transcript_32176/g.52175 Transcript_32176/m.52175 type:complete len:92 (-) Transcript_32176:203-478(-)
MYFFLGDQDPKMDAVEGSITVLPSYMIRDQKSKAFTKIIFPRDMIIELCSCLSWQRGLIHQLCPSLLILRRDDQNKCLYAQVMSFAHPYKQ